MEKPKTEMSGYELFKEKEKEFHKSRVAFAILHNGTYVITKNDEREHLVWLSEDYGISNEEFETIIRGYIKPGKIMFYKSSNFTPIENEEILLDYIEKYIGITTLQNFGAGYYIVSNGVIKGNIGEEWKASSTPYTVKISGSFKRKIHNVNVQIV